MCDDAGPVLLGVDVGGTFTDAVAVANGVVHTAKVLSTDPQSAGVLQAAAAALDAAGRGVSSVSRFVHGMTVATNALLERSGARVAVVVTDGFRDLLEIGRQHRAELYTFHPRRTVPLSSRELCLAVRERVGPDGVLIPLEAAAVEEVCDRVAAVRPEAVAVCLLWSFRAPQHERTLQSAFAERMPGVPVSCSVEVSPLFREYERLSTTVVDAYVTPSTRGYLRALADACRAAGLRQPEIMQSSGGTTSLSEAASHGGRLLLSGPAGGVVAARGSGGSLGLERVISFDMGGTSTDCAAFSVGDPSQPLETAGERRIAGHAVRLPAVDIHTVSAGGGSIAWVDDGGALKVGPSSAGASPGPACYGRGGTRATVTDAHVVLGRIPSDTALAGTLHLDSAAARAAMVAVGDPCGLSAEETAEGVVRVATFNMAAALRAVTLERGLDPRTYALVAFGGAGGLHACELAEEVGVSTVVVPVHAGVLSALGLVLAPPRADRALTLLREAGELSAAEWESLWAGLEGEVRRALLGRGDRSEGDLFLRREVEARYSGQSHESIVTLAPEAGPEKAATAFAVAHERLYGYADPDAAVEFVTLRCVGSVASTDGVMPSAPPALERSADVSVYRDGRRRPCPAFRVSFPPEGTGEEWVAAAAAVGPALLTARDMSIWVEPGWEARAEPGAVVMRRDSPDRPRGPSETGATRVAGGAAP